MGCKSPAKLLGASMIDEIETLPHAASVVLAALQRSRAWHSEERLREAVERAIEILMTLDLLGAAQELIDRLDAIDGDADLEHSLSGSIDDREAEHDGREPEPFQ